MPSLTQSRRQLILANAPSTPQISLPSRSGHTALRCCNFLAQNLFQKSSICNSATASVELCSPCSEVPWSIAAVYRRACDSSFAKTHTVSALSAWVFNKASCTWCGLWDLEMQNLREFPSHNPPLEACEKESSIFPRRAPEASAASREIAASREAATWGSDVELEEMESEQTGLAFSLPPSPERVHRLNSRKITFFLARGHVIPSPSE